LDVVVVIGWFLTSGGQSALWCDRTEGDSWVSKHVRLATGKEVPAQSPTRREEPGNILRLAALVTLGSVASGLAIGAGLGTLDGILTGVMLALGISLLFWLGAFVVSGFVLLGRLADWLLLSPTREMPQDSGGGGVRDSWLDGPPCL
jgi:hypothetical protein